MVGEQWGKVRALISDSGERIKTAGPSTPVEVLGLNGTPEAIEADIASKLRVGVDIVGPECAVPLDAPYENLKHIAVAARKLGQTRNQG
ncbi:MAG: hypothetical protein HN380_11400 [Victivallales bacterium]|nr:hypothetical protein [Victivallales bacterium]